MVSLFIGPAESFTAYVINIHIYKHTDLEGSLTICSLRKAVVMCSFLGPVHSPAIYRLSTQVVPGTYFLPWGEPQIQSQGNQFSPTQPCYCTILKTPMNIANFISRSNLEGIGSKEFSRSTQTENSLPPLWQLYTDLEWPVSSYYFLNSSRTNKASTHLCIHSARHTQ